MYLHRLCRSSVVGVTMVSLLRQLLYFLVSEFQAQSQSSANSILLIVRSCIIGRSNTYQISVQCSTKQFLNSMRFPEVDVVWCTARCWCYRATRLKTTRRGCAFSVYIGRASTARGVDLGHNRACVHARFSIEALFDLLRVHVLLLRVTGVCVSSWWNQRPKQQYSSTTTVVVS